jgi:hypothetical protein
MKRILLACAVSVPMVAFAANPHYEYNNSNQQYAIEKAVYDEVIQQTLNTKCSSSVNTTIPEVFLLNTNRYVDVEVIIYKDKKKVGSLSQSVTYRSYDKFKYALYQIVTLQCR